MIFFTVDNDVKGDFYHAARLTRQIFCYKDGLLLQSRLYPANDNDIRKLYRELVQQAVAICLNAPNLWKSKAELAEIQPFWLTPEEALHSRDYNNGYAVLSFLRSKEHYEPLVIGKQSLCVVCGRPLRDHHALKCFDCNDVVVCKECGTVIDRVYANHVDGAYYCTKCTARCDCCGTLVRRGQLQSAIRRSGRMAQLCEQCFANTTEHCGQCSSREICQIVRAERFCSRVEYAAAAA